MVEGLVLCDVVLSMDVVLVIEQVEMCCGNDGVFWVGGSNVGGFGQFVIKVVGDVICVGYNLVNGCGVIDMLVIVLVSCMSLLC